MHIGMIYVIPPASPTNLDPRLLKEVSALGPAGFRVSVLCPQIDGRSPDDHALMPNVDLVPAAVPLPTLLGRISSSWTLRFPLWRPVIERFVEEREIDVLHVRDLPMVRTTLSVARPRNIPVVADFYENWPAAQESYRGHRSGLYQRYIRFSRGHVLYRRYERRCVDQCARIVVVVPEAIDRFRDAGFREDRFVVVSNTEDESTIALPKPGPVPDELALMEGRWTAIYHGNVGPHRGLETVIRAIPRIVETVPNFLLMIFGSSDQWMSRLRDLVRSLGVEEHLEVRGWTPLSTCLTAGRLSQVGVVPHEDFEHTQTTIPHKLFQYMMLGIPVVVSDCRPLRRVVNQSEAGVVFRAGDPADCARVIRRLASDPARCQALGTNGRRAASSTYAWKRDAARLVEMYHEIDRERG